MGRSERGTMGGRALAGNGRIWPLCGLSVQLLLHRDSQWTIERDKSLGVCSAVCDCVRVGPRAASQRM